jgi:hypothetical protein
LDGVLALYDPKRHADEIGPPRDGVTEFLKAIKRAGHTIIVFTCRRTQQVEDWLVEHNLEPNLVDYINHNPRNEELRQNPGKPVAHLYIDDRAWPNFGDPVDLAAVLDSLRERGWLEAA